MAKKKTKKKTTRKKTTRKKATTRKTASRSTTRKKKTTKRKAGDRPRTKSQIFGDIAEETGLARREIAEVFDAMNKLIKKDLGRSGPGTFTVPGLMKIQKVHKPKKNARKGINPFTGEEMMFKAKPAHNVVKVRALKGLKEMV